MQRRCKIALLACVMLFLINALSEMAMAEPTSTPPSSVQPNQIHPNAASPATVPRGSRGDPGRLAQPGCVNANAAVSVSEAASPEELAVVDTAARLTPDDQRLPDASTAPAQEAIKAKVPGQLNQPWVIGEGEDAFTITLPQAAPRSAHQHAHGQIFANGLPATDLEVEQSGNNLRLLTVMQTPEAASSVRFDFSLACPQGGKSQKGRIQLEQGPDGSVAVNLQLNRTQRQGLGMIAPPWAVDANGTKLPTSYEVVNQTTLVQHVDTRGAVYPIVADPTYTSVGCSYGYYATASVQQYLDLGYCPIWSWFYKKHGYFPVKAWETNVGNDVGWVFVRQSGECSWAPDTTSYYDFQVPCKAHDYCYDLIRAGMIHKDYKSACDDFFYLLMTAHCNDRAYNIRPFCYAARDAFKAAVDNVSGPSNSPPWLSFINMNSWQCAAVSGDSTQAGAQWIQWPCHYGSSQQYRPEIIKGHTQFLLKPRLNTALCITRLPVFAATGTQQCTADAYGTYVESQRWKIQGAFNGNQYTIRDTTQSGCLDVPYSSTDAGKPLITYYCYETPNQIWVIS